MRVFHGFEALPHFTHPAVTVGSYDGVHSGHLKLLRTVTAAARGQGGESIVFTFEPHPRITLGKADGLRLLTTLDEKICLLERLGIDNLVIIPFDRAFSRLAPDEFVRDCLVGHTGAETLVVGFNHRFGHNKQGSYDYLDSHGFGLRVIEVSECDVDAEKVSSTVIRRLVEKGEMARAAHLLSHPYLVIGRAQRNRIRVDDPLLRTAIKLLTIPLVVGIGYELIKLAGRKTNWFTKAISAPGMWLQHITTKEPDDSMIECAIAALKEVIPADPEADNW